MMMRMIGSYIFINIGMITMMEWIDIWLTIDDATHGKQQQQQQQQQETYVQQ